MIAWTHCGTLPPIGHRRAGLENDAERVEEPEAPDAPVDIDIMGACRIVRAFTVPDDISAARTAFADRAPTAARGSIPAHPTRQGERS